MAAGHVSEYALFSTVPLITGKIFVSVECLVLGIKRLKVFGTLIHRHFK